MSIVSADYRSPTSGSAAAATTPARLAEKHDEVRWRELPEGSIEVAVRDGNRVYRLRVLENGDTVLTHELVLRPIARAEAFVKTSFVVAVVALGLLWIPVWGHGFQNVLVMTFLAAMALAFVARVYTWPVTLGWTRRLGSGWHRPTKLDGWFPRSSAQITTVESIAERHGGQAWVYDQGIEPLLVRARGWPRFHYWLVEDDGLSTKQAGDIAFGGMDDSHTWVRIETRDRD